MTFCESQPHESVKHSGISFFTQFAYRNSFAERKITHSLKVT